VGKVSVGNVGVAVHEPLKGALAGTETDVELKELPPPPREVELDGLAPGVREVAGLELAPGIELDGLAPGVREVAGLELAPGIELEPAPGVREGDAEGLELGTGLEDPGTLVDPDLDGLGIDELPGDGVGVLLGGMGSGALAGIAGGWNVGTGEATHS